jgi:hypothetical protein
VGIDSIAGALIPNTGRFPCYAEHFGGARSSACQGVENSHRVTLLRFLTSRVKPDSVVSLSIDGRPYRVSNSDYK